MGCGASTQATEGVTQHNSTTQTDEKKELPSRRKRWVCGKCTLHNKEGAPRCGACGSSFDSTAWAHTTADGGRAHGSVDNLQTADTTLPHARFTTPVSATSSASSTSSSSWKKKRAHFEDATCHVQFLWSVGDEAEACMDGVWQPCRVVVSSKAQVNVQIKGVVHAKEHHDVRRPRLAECCICLEPLCQKLLGALVDENGARVCRHYIHKVCGCALPVQTCPVCRAEFSQVVQVPRADRYPKEWFRVVGYSKTGSLSPQEVKAALSATVPFSEEDVHTIIKENWSTWDPQNIGYISYKQVQLIVRHFFL